MSKRTCNCRIWDFLAVLYSVSAPLISGSSLGDEGLVGTLFPECSSPTVGAVFSAMKTVYVTVAEQTHPLGPAYSIPY